MVFETELKGFLTVPGKSFREEQCEAFNGYNHSTNRLTATVSWVPKYSGVSPRDKCKLICRANGTGYFYVLAPKVSWGTSQLIGTTLEKKSVLGPNKLAKWAGKENPFNGN